MNKQNKIPFEMAMEYAKGNGEKMAAWEDGFVAGILYQIQKEQNKLYPLTIEQIQAIDDVTLSDYYVEEQALAFARAIEKAHGIY